ncbi:MAG: ABC transporter [Proteobacteria bacterium]|nr:MAG: ABC transporter [Pseudomonadota bacterium]
MKMTKHAHHSLLLQNMIFYLLLAAIVGLLAFFSREFRIQADWTQGQRNSLTASTQQLLESIEQPLKFVAYVPDEQALHAQLERLVNKYRKVKADTQLEFVNPDLDPARAKADGVDYAGQLAIHLGSRSEVVDSVSEQVIANALLRLSRTGDHLIVFLEGHGERDPLSDTSNGLSRLREILERSGFAVQPHSLVRTQSIPDNARFLVIASPQREVLPGEVDVILDYIRQGGNLLWLADPGGLQGLQDLADLLGIRVHEGTVLDANEQLHALLGITHPAVVPVVDYGRSVLGEKLTGSQSLFPFATMVERHPRARPTLGALAWNTDEFLMTLPNSWMETSPIDGSVTYEEEAGDQLGPVPIGLTLTRLLEKPQDSLGSAANDFSIASSTDERQQRIVVIGDSDFLLNSFIGKGVNLTLGSNIFNWLASDDQLLHIPVVTAPDTNFHMNETLGVVLALFFLFVLPLGLVLAGVIIWLRRRRR